MSRFLLVVLVLWLACASAHAGGVSLTAIDTRPDATGVNLVPNGSFESTGPDGMPDGWKWDKRNTNATCVVDNTTAAEGRRCVRFTNSTPSMTGVYGELLIKAPVALEKGKPYTLSAWTKSENPGFARLGGGSDWQYRFTLPATGGKWQRVSLTFTPTESTKDFEVSLVTKGVTKALWLDDVRLEAGPRATISQSDPRVCPEAREQELLTEGEFAVPFLVSVPKAMSAKLEATISGRKQRVSRTVDLKAGVAQVTIKGASDAADPTPKTVTLRLVDGKNELASARMSIRFYSRKYAQTQLDEVAQRVPLLKRRLDALKASGQDVSYPQVSYTVLENFTGYAKEDVTKGETKRAIMQLRDLDSIVKSLDREIADASSGKTKLPAVPRWTGESRPVIKGSSFVSTTRTPGRPGTETGPVFFTGYGHFGQVRNDIEKFPSYGTNIIQFEVGPWSVFPEEGKVVEAVGTNLLPILDRAQKAGIAVNLLLSPHYMPEWMFRKYPDLRKRREYFIPYCVHAPEAQELLKRYIAIVIPPIKDHPALNSICISNEPRNAEEPCEPGARDWHNWLKARHGDIATLNSRWDTDYASIDDVPLPNPFDPKSDAPIGRWADYIRWNQEYFAGWHKMLADAVHAVAPNLPVHAKIQSATLSNSWEVQLGNDPYLMGQVCEINGNDGMNLYTYGEDTFAQSWVANALGYDLQRSTRDAPVFNSENHVILDRELRYVPAEQVSCALWQQAIHGQSATTIWVWERTTDKSSDFAGSIMHRPACARAVGIANCDLNRAAREVTALQQAPAQVLVLHDTSSMSRDKESYGRSMLRLYTSLALCGVKVGFVTERQLENGLVPSAPVVCIPVARYLSNAAFDALKRYKGRVITLAGDALAYDEFGKARADRLATESVPYDLDNTGARELSASLMAKLVSWNVRPPVEAVDKQGRPIWGVEWRTAQTSDGVLVNLCNYLTTPVTLKLTRSGKGVTATDVLSGETVKGLVTLQPLAPKLVRVAR